MTSQGMERAETITRLRARIGAGRHDYRPRIGFGMEPIDDHLGGGLATGALHEMLGQGPDTEHGTTASLLVAGLLAGFAPERQVLWAMQGHDLHPPGLAAVGLSPQRLILAECGGSVAAVMEEALRHPGLAAVVGEIEGGFGLTASRRLQLAAESAGVTAFAIRRSRRFDDPALLAPSAAHSRWRVGVLPEDRQTGLPGLLSGRASWRLELLRSRHATPFQWTVQACDAEGRLADEHDDPRIPAHRIPVPALLADRSPAAFQPGFQQGFRRAG